MVRATADAPFARHLKDKNAEREPRKLYTQVVNAVNREKREMARSQQLGTASSAGFGGPGGSIPPQSPTFYVNEPGEYEILYTNTSAPSIRRRAMRNPLREFRSRGSSSRGRGRYYAGRERRLTSMPIPKFNKKDHSGNYMLCNLCNSWFHLIADCPHRTHATQIMFEEDFAPETEDEPVEDSGPSEQIRAEKQHDQDEYAATFFAQVVEQRSTYYCTGCMP